jgi:transposase
MARKQLSITKEIYLNAREAIKDSPKGCKTHYRLQALIAGYEQNISQVCSVLNVLPQTIRSWSQRFASEGTAGLIDKPKPGRTSHIQPIHEEAITCWLREDSQLTIHAIKLKLEAEFSLKTNKSSVHRTLQSLRFSYITPRPQHHKQDKNQHPDFKKKSAVADSSAPK